MNNTELIRLQLNHLVTQSRHDLYTLSRTNDYYMKQQIIQRLWDALSSIHFLSELLANHAAKHSASVQTQGMLQQVSGTQPQNSPITSLPNQNTQPNNQRVLSIEELSTFDGKNGKPAYVSVNGTVYDMTNNRAWAAATHFGLIAGKEYTQEFASCHAGQQSILTTLPVVGRLME